MLNFFSQNVVPRLIPLVEKVEVVGSMPDVSLYVEERQHLLLQVLITLTNLAALSDWHKQFCGSLNR